MTYRSLSAKIYTVFTLLLTARNSAEYSLPVGTGDQERLICLNELLNPCSLSFLSQYLKPGDRVLELGAGLGIMSQEIAKMVGNTGTVPATALLIGTNAISTHKTSTYNLPVNNEVVNPHSMSFLKTHVKAGDHVLELGAGLGLMSQEVAKMTENTGAVLATDIDDAQLELARSLAQGKQLPWLCFEYADAYDLSNLTEQFDVVYIRLLLMHLDDPFRVIEQAKHVLKPGGMLLIEEACGSLRDAVYCKPYDTRIEFVKELYRLLEIVIKLNINIPLQLKEKLPLNGFHLLSYNETQTKLDTPKKREIFSLELNALQSLLLSHEVINEKQLGVMKHEILSLARDTTVELYDIKISHIAARIK